MAMPEIERPQGDGQPIVSDSQPSVDNVAKHEELYRIAYDESRRTLDDQKDEIKEMRDRAIQVAIFIGAATAFLVAAGLQDPHRDNTFYTIAIAGTLDSALFVVALFAVLGLDFSLKRAWNYRLSATALIDGWIEAEAPPPSDAHFIRELARTYDTMRQVNERFLRPLRAWYRWLLVAGVTQVTIWAALVWVKS
jgi:hypothetical protein